MHFSFTLYWFISPHHLRQLLKASKYFIVNQSPCCGIYETSDCMKGCIFQSTILKQIQWKIFLDINTLTWSSKKRFVVWAARGNGKIILKKHFTLRYFFHRLWLPQSSSYTSSRLCTLSWGCTVRYLYGICCSWID